MSTLPPLQALGAPQIVADQERGGVIRIQNTTSKSRD